MKRHILTFFKIMLFKGFLFGLLAILEIFACDLAP
jgi:hypothetical protein